MPLFDTSGGKYSYQDQGLPPEDEMKDHARFVLRDPGQFEIMEPENRGDATTITFLPYPDFDGQRDAAGQPLQVMPDRLTAAPHDFSAWLVSAWGVRYFGKRGITLVFDLKDPRGFSRNSLDHPATMLRETIRNALKDTREVIGNNFGNSVTDNWAVLAFGGEKGSKPYPCLPRPQKLHFGFAAVFASGGKTFVMGGNPPRGAAKGDKTVVFMYSQDTAKQFTTELMRTKPGVQPYKDIAGYVHDRITGVKYVHFYPREKGQCPAMLNAQAAYVGDGNEFGARRTIQQEDDADGTFQKGYKVFLSDTMNGVPAPGGPQLVYNRYAALAVTRAQPWEKVLKGHTEAECAELIHRHCGLPASMLYHAWKNHKEWLPDELATMASNPVSANFYRPPGYPAQPQGGYGQPYSPPADGYGGQPGYQPAPAGQPYGGGGYAAPHQPAAEQPNPWMSGGGGGPPAPYQAPAQPPQQPQPADYSNNPWMSGGGNGAAAPQPASYQAPAQPPQHPPAPQGPGQYQPQAQPGGPPQQYQAPAQPPAAAGHFSGMTLPDAGSLPPPREAPAGLVDEAARKAMMDRFREQAAAMAQGNAAAQRTQAGGQ